MPEDVPPGFTVRTASLDDAPELAELINEINVAEVGTPLTNVDDVRSALTTPGREDGDDVVLISSDGRIIGSLELWTDEDPFTEVQLMSWVRPTHWGHGLNASLLRLGERKARDKVRRIAIDSPVFLRVSRWASNEAAGRLFADLGYSFARTFHVMRLVLDGPIAAPEVLSSITIRTFDRTDARAVHTALTEAFAEHWGQATNAPAPFDEWVHDHITGPSAGFDAGLWFVAVDGDEVVGAVCCRATTPRTPDEASVHLLGVRPAWRGRGIARALLLHAFLELKRRGVSAVHLGVDSENQTGATQLYERVGMQTESTYEFWEKEM